VLSLNQLRKSNERQRDHQVLERNNQRNNVGGRINSNPCNLKAAHSLETNDYATRKVFRNSIKSSVPVVIDLRQNSDKEIIEQNMKLRTEGQQKFVTSALFENSENLCSRPRPDTELVPQTNYRVILDKADEMMNNEAYTQSSKVKEIGDEADYFKNFQQLEESIHMEDIEQLSPHSGYDSVTFDQNEDLEFLDFVDPAEFGKDNQLASWTNLLPGTKNVRRAQLWDNTMAYQVESIIRKAEDCLEKSNNNNVDENNKAIEEETYADFFLQEQIGNNSWQIQSDMTSIETVSGTSNNLKNQARPGILTLNKSRTCNIVFVCLSYLPVIGLECSALAYHVRPGKGSLE
jgi:hypothetical protein